MAGTRAGALKAWQTIRAKQAQQKRKRRQAALKAWKTIRAKAQSE